MRFQVSIVLMAIALCGCGWHLRGAVKLPPELASTHIQTDDEYTDFYRELKRALRSGGVRLIDRPGPEHAIVRIRGESFGQRVAAVSPRNTPQEFQVFYAVNWSLEADGREVFPPENMELTANYSYDSTLALAKQREQRTLQIALARQLALQVMRRLGATQQAIDAIKSTEVAPQIDGPSGPPSETLPSNR